MPIVTSWMKQGIEQGIEQGELKLLLKQLVRRCAPLSPELEAQVRQLSIAQIKALLDSSGEADLVAWLAQCN